MGGRACGKNKGGTKMRGALGKHKKIKIAVIILVSTVLIYLLFFANLNSFDTNETQISERAALRECPGIEITDYDREFLDKILYYKEFEVLENSERYASMSVTADEAGFERYALRPDENYTVHADYNMYGMLSLSVSIQFEDDDGLYREDLFLSADKTDSGTDYCKAVTVQRSDGKFIKRYWSWHNGERYTKETYLYGIVGWIKALMNAMYGC